MEASLAPWGPARCTKEATRAEERAFTLTDVPGDGVAALYLRPADDVPDAGHPVSQQSKGRHEQRQNHGAVLGVAVQFLQQAQQPQQTHRFQQVHQGRLEGDGEKARQFFSHAAACCCIPGIDNDNPVSVGAELSAEFASVSLKDAVHMSWGSLFRRVIS